MLFCHMSLGFDNGGGEKKEKMQWRYWLAISYRLKLNLYEGVPLQIPKLETPEKSQTWNKKERYDGCHSSN